MRYLVLALDVIGAVLFACGLCLLASLAHPYLVPVVLGGLILVVAAVVERSRRQRPGE